MKLNFQLRYRYFFARIFAIGYKPAILIYLDKFGTTNDLTTYSLMLLIYGIGILVSSSDTFRDYYKSYFEFGSNCSAKYIEYISRLTIVNILGLSVVIILGILYKLDEYLTVMCFFLVLSDRIFDECQRFNLYSKKFILWSNFSIFKNLLIYVFIGCLLVLGKEIDLFDFIFTILFLSIASNIVYLFKNKEIINSILRLRVKIYYNLRIGIYNIKFETISLLKYSSLNIISYSDRLIAAIVDLNLLPAFTFLNMTFGFIQLSMDLFFTSQYRKDLLLGRFDIRKIFDNKLFWLGLAFGLFLSLIIIIGYILFINSSMSIPWYGCLFYLTFNVLISIAAIFQQIVYWRSSINRCIHIELNVLLVGLIITLLIIVFKGGYLFYLVMILFVTILRYFLYQKELLKL